jgi:hypothetical protein
MYLKSGIIIINIIIVLSSILLALTPSDKLMVENKNLNIEVDTESLKYDPLYYSVLNNTQYQIMKLLVRNYKSEDTFFYFNITYLPNNNESIYENSCEEIHRFCINNSLIINLPESRRVTKEDIGYILMNINIHNEMKKGNYKFKIESFTKEEDSTKLYAIETFSVNIGTEYFKYDSGEEVEHAIRSLQMTTLLFISVIMIGIIFLFMMILKMTKEKE